MAHLSFDVYCDSLKRRVNCHAILPTDQKSGLFNGPYKTIYLLHGLTHSSFQWVDCSRIREWAENNRFAVIMPSGENSFYVDSTVPNNEYGRFIGHELVEITRAMFPLSRKREDTYIGGLSMGGFGAIRNGFRYNDTFGAIVALSSAIHFFETPLGQPCDNRHHEELVFGDLAAAHKTDKNPRVIVNGLIDKKNAGEAVNIPAIYMACGTEDGLIGANRSFRDFLREKGVEVTYTEAPGVHDWDFWNEYMLKAIHWLELDK